MCWLIFMVGVVINNTLLTAHLSECVSLRENSPDTRGSWVLTMPASDLTTVPCSLVCDGQTSPHTPRLVVSHSTCPSLSSSPHAHSFVLGSTAAINIMSGFDPPIDPAHGHPIYTCLGQDPIVSKGSFDPLGAAPKEPYNRKRGQTKRPGNVLTRNVLMRIR